MKINCLCCGFKVELDDDAYADYKGQTKCYICGRLLEIRTIDGKLKSVQLVEDMGTQPGQRTKRYANAGTV